MQLSLQGQRDLKVYGYHNFPHIYFSPLALFLIRWGWYPVKNSICFYNRDFSDEIKNIMAASRIQSFVNGVVIEVRNV